MRGSPNDDDENREPEVPDDDPPETPPDERLPLPIQDPSPDATPASPMTVEGARTRTAFTRR
jgi:hypothetical protein